MKKKRNGRTNEREGTDENDGESKKPETRTQAKTFLGSEDLEKEERRRTRKEGDKKEARKEGRLRGTGIGEKGKVQQVKQEGSHHEGIRGS